jgi:hypothetical protein
MFFLFLLSCIVSWDAVDNTATIGVTKPDLVYSISMKYSVGSSLKIVNYKDGEMVGHGSGNYFKLGSHKFIITAAHVVENETEKYVIDGINIIKLRTVYIDMFNDVALMIPEQEVKTIEPVYFRLNDEINLLGETVYHAGFPSDVGKAAFRGFVSQSDKRRILMQSVALPGSSGSVVFDDNGRVIGVLSAVKVVNFLSPELVETLVYVERMVFLRQMPLLEILRDAG